MQMMMMMMMLVEALVSLYMEYYLQAYMKADAWPQLTLDILKQQQQLSGSWKAEAATGEANRQKVLSKEQIFS